MPVYYTIFCGKRQEVFLRGGRGPLRTPFFSPCLPRRGFAELVAPAPTMRALRPAPRPTFSRRESRQRYARNLLVPGPPAKGPALCPSGIGCGSLNPQASSGSSHLPRHGLTAGSATPGVAWGEKKTDLPTQLKVANRSFVVAESSPARDGAQRSEREKGGGHAPGDSKGRSPWRAFGDFPRDGKVTRVQGGAPASGVAGATSPAKTPGARGGAPSARQAVGPRTKPMRELGAGSACPGLDFFHRIGYNILDQQSLKGRCGQ